MTPEAQRIAIAEACGELQAHTTKPTIEELEDILNDPAHRTVTLLPNGEVRALPDYLDDLNAMHEAEKAVIFKDVKLYLKFATELEMVVGGNIDALFATAAQRAEAFLRTLGLWKE